MNRDVTVAFAGFPNVGKSTIFNYLTGMKQRTGNWAGVTVELSHGGYSYNEKNYVLTDLPGTYSLISQSEDEKVAAMYICKEKPDVTVVVCDGLCIERNLNLVLQVLDITNKVVVCINFSDQMVKNNVHIDVDGLSKLLGVPVVLTTGKCGIGLEDLKTSIETIAHNEIPPEDIVNYGSVIEGCLNKIEGSTLEYFPKLSYSKVRFASLRLICDDYDSYKSITETDTLPKNVADAYEYSKAVIKASFPKDSTIDDIISTKILNLAKKTASETVTDGNARTLKASAKIDKIVTSKLYGIPIMLALLCLVFYITITFANYPSTFLATHLFAFEEKLLHWSSLVGTPAWLEGILILGVYRTIAWVVVNIRYTGKSPLLKK